MKISEKIKNSLIHDNRRFFACDNISEYITAEDKILLIDELTEEFEKIMNSMIIDIENDPNSKETPHRLAKMYINELFSGRFDKKPKITAFPNGEENRYDGMLVIRSDIKSVCSHHWQPVVGVAYVGIIPNDKVIGLSKYIRLCQWHARRGTLQEELAVNIRKDISNVTKTDDVAVYIQATHGCVSCRGVNQNNSMTQTISLGGAFKEKNVKDEFYNNIKMNIMASKQC